MIFNSIEYIVFLPLVLVAYWTAGGRRPRNGVLLVASYIFYGFWDWRFLGLIAVSTCADFLIAPRVAASDAEGRRKAWLFLSLGINLGILVYFKYAGFFVDSAIDLGNRVGLDLDASTLDIVLPVGISFYTFQTISYTFDVFRRRIDPERSLLTFAVYVAYFPQLVAGPIERAQHLLPQLQRDTVPLPRSLEIRAGLVLILTGLVKKVVIADSVAPIANAAFESPAERGSALLVAGVVAFALQIYGDFSGYSSIARGTSRLFGIELIRNFEQPYLSTSITQFWRTWHISLSSWLHDYLYIPLGGNRGARIVTVRNLMVTMLLGGLWHGASWNFVVWGGLHGAALGVHRAMGAYQRRGRPAPPGLGDVWRIAATYAFVAALWVFFRAESLADSIDYFRGIFALRGFSIPRPDFWRSEVVLLATMVAAGLAMDLVDRRRAEVQPLQNWGPFRWGVIVGVLAATLVVWSGGQPEPFIYFQF